MVAEIPGGRDYPRTQGNDLRPDSAPETPEAAGRFWKPERLAVIGMQATEKRLARGYGTDAGMLRANTTSIRGLYHGLEINTRGKTR